MCTHNNHRRKAKKTDTMTYLEDVAFPGLSVEDSGGEELSGVNINMEGKLLLILAGNQ